MISESAAMTKAEMWETGPQCNGTVGTQGLLHPLWMCAWQQKAAREPGYCRTEPPVRMFGPCDQKEDHLSSGCLEFHSCENLY